MPAPVLTLTADRPGRGAASASLFAERSRVALIALLALGIAVRVGGAWIFRYADKSDQGIVDLMAKHIAEGKPFPVFFYGQAYMGSLEPAISALFCALFGFSGFAVSLGTAAVGFLLLPVVYLLARDIAGRGAGLAALAFSIVGPVGYFHYMHSPRGGYAVTLLLGTLLLWHGGRLALRHGAAAHAPRGGYLLLGLIGGVGWWSNQLIAASLLATGLLLLAVLGKKAVGWHLIPAACGFLLGSLPFWVWNFRHDWASFSLVRSLGTTTYIEALRALLTRRLPEILNIGREGLQDATGVGVAPLLASIGGWLAAALLAGAVAVALALWAAEVRSGRRSLASIQLTGIFLFLAVSVLLASGSSYALLNTPRYLLPLVPALAVVAAVAAARLSRFLKGAVAILSLLLLIGWHATLVAKTFGGRPLAQEVLAAGARQLGAELRAAGVGVVYVPYVHHIYNSLLREEFVFCDIKGERYAPYALRAESSDDVAVLDDYGHVTDFVRSAGGSCESAGSGGHSFVHRFRPPAAAERELPPADWSAARDLARGDELLRTLTDGDASTSWAALPAVPGEPVTLEIAFAAPVELSRVRLLTRGRFPAKSRWQIWGRGNEPGAPWASVSGEALVTQFFWSGPRPFFGGAFHRLEARFPKATVGAIRIVLRFQAADPVDVTEVHAFAPSGSSPAVPETTALPRLLEILDAGGISRLLCDRWVANAVRRRPGNRVETPEERGISTMGTTVEHPVQLAPGTALLVRQEDAGICRRTLADNGITLAETPIGPWVLFEQEPGPAGGMSPAGHRAGPLLWTGTVCLSRGAGEQAAPGRQ